MKKTKFTEAHIGFALRQANMGVTVAEVCCKRGVSEATYYKLEEKIRGTGRAQTASA
jgi:putative transposase